MAAPGGDIAREYPFLQVLTQWVFGNLTKM
jgi:hypothetical protein